MSRRPAVSWKCRGATGIVGRCCRGISTSRLFLPLHDTGIVSVMGLQLDDLVLQAELNLLTRLDAPHC
jgi:hypothetical protein